MDHFEVHLGVAKLMLEFSQQLNLHVGEDLHFVHDFVMTSVERDWEVQLGEG